jgi:Flp pilus assembly protein TadB
MAGESRKRSGAGAVAAGAPQWPDDHPRLRNAGRVADRVVSARASNYLVPGSTQSAGGWEWALGAWDHEEFGGPATPPRRARGGDRSPGSERMTLVAAMLGALFALGLVTFAVAMRPVAPGETPERRHRPPVRTRVENLVLRLALGIGVAVVVGVITRWPMAALLLGLAGFLAPSLLGGEAQRKAKLDRVEGIAAWAEMLRDTMAGSGGLEQSIIATAGVAPPAIRREVLRLAARLERERLAPALREFADELDDPSGDLVVAALILAADKSPKRLGDLLGRLADSARDEVNMRLRVDAGRSRTRTSVKVITVFTTLFATFLIVFNRSYLEPYDSLVGQMVMAFVGLCFGAAFYWLARTFRVEEDERFLRTDGGEA